MSRDELLGNADIALGESESSGRSFVVYTPQLGERYRERLRIERLLSADIADDFKNFSIVYQPFVNTRGKIVGSEALVRWNNPELGEVSPARFVPIAEESGDIRVMGQWVLFNACRHLRDWRKQYDKELYVSVNLSPLQFKQPDLVDRIQGVLAALGLEGDGLKLEITEGVIMEDPTDAIEKMEGLKAAGIRISVDDFGTGYSSLNYLKRFPIDTVKIDKSFVEDLENNVSNQEIVKAIISMAHNIRIETLAEGVETVSQFDFLVNEQCRIIQGYLFSRPINAAGFEDFLRNGEALKPS
jgi:EAL domain-containing protein (putative c-di-GMP-specific phosphodiesterase class I)